MQGLKHKKQPKTPEEERIENHMAQEESKQAPADSFDFLEIKYGPTGNVQKIYQAGLNGQ